MTIRLAPPGRLWPSLRSGHHLAVPVSTRWWTTTSSHWLVLGLVLVALSVRLPLALERMYLWPDGIEYLDMARHLASGQGFMLTVKAYYVDDSPVVHNGLTVRPPLYPLVLAPLAVLPGWPLSTQVLNAVLAAANTGLVYLLARSFTSRAVAFAAGLVAALGVPMVATTLRPMSEQLTLFLTLLAFLLAGRTGRSYALAAGGAIGLAFLARSASLILLPAVVLGVMLCNESGKRLGLNRSLLPVLGFSVVAVTAVLWSQLTYGRVYLGPTFNYSVSGSAEVMRGGFRDEPIPSPVSYVTTNFGRVLRDVRDKLGDYTRTLLTDPDWAVVVLPGLLLMLTALAFRRLPPACLPLLLAAGLHFLITVSTWAVSSEERYLLPTFVFLLPVCLLGWALLPGAGRALWRGSRFTWLHVALAATVVLTASQTVRDPLGGRNRGPLLGAVWVGTPRAWANPDIERLMAWVERQTTPSDIVAHEQPWVITYFTQRPTALLPTQLSAAQLDRFLREMRVNYVVIDRNDVDRQDYIVRLERMGDRAAPLVAQFGSYRIFATSRLWQ